MLHLLISYCSNKIDLIGINFKRHRIVEPLCLALRRSTRLSLCPAGLFPPAAGSALPYLNLIPVMPLYAPYRLPQAPRPPVPVVWVGCPIRTNFRRIDKVAVWEFYVFQ